MASTNSTQGEYVPELSYWIRFHSDGTAERLRNTPFAPPSLNDPKTGVSSKDIIISHNPPISARIYLPNLTTNSSKLPILVYYHGGGFFFESAFSEIFHNHLTKLVSTANVLVVSVEYRLAPETPLPAAYDDSWAALKWVASHSTKDTVAEPWLTEHGDFNRVFIGGDSAGGNIVHNIISTHGSEDLPGNVKIYGAVLIQPYFYGSEPAGSESATGREANFYNSVWKLVYPSAPGGIDSPFMNPLAPGAPSMDKLACSRMIVCVAEKDGMRDKVVLYYEAVKKSGWQGKIELFEEKEEDHAYQLLKPESEAAIKMINHVASFLVHEY